MSHFSQGHSGVRGPHGPLPFYENKRGDETFAFSCCLPVPLKVAFVLFCYCFRSLVPFQTADSDFYFAAGEGGIFL